MSSPITTEALAEMASVLMQRISGNMFRNNRWESRRTVPGDVLYSG